MHARTRIRSAIAAALASIAPVTANRDDPLPADALPCIGLFTPDEATQELTMGSRRQMRRMDLYVDGYVRAGADLDDQLDAMALRIERAIAAGGKFGGTLDRIELLRTVTDRLTSGELKAGVTRLQFAVTYQTKFGQPDA
ncbi:hypothetical protein [Azospirillum lipoferum]|uniref:Uncharacterized protein n=1 Tax=Azospirillum lipoferum (strain 4B) TaxID=862719 RepID=G7ZBJ5_AZOL4|nr:hypothetical protein [Azospirillum lipoferum]CBS88719.1 exported protein of unknown function [Azospirillum lipoferum 4B]